MLKILDYIFCCRYCRPKKSETDSNDYYNTKWKSLVFNSIESERDVREVFDKKQIQMKDQRYENPLDFCKEVLESENYKLVSEEPLGKGGFGYVYHIQHKLTGDVRAVKTIRLQIGGESIDGFKNEIYALTKVNHKNIIQLFDHFFIPDVMCFLIIELASDGDLRKQLKQRYKHSKKAFDENVAKDYFIQMANALNFVHKNHLIHGDLKLDNVLITQSGGRQVVKVSDFGCAQVGYREDQVECRVGALGTTLYMSPEQMRVFICVNLKKPQLFKFPSYRYNPMKADVWALGVCLYKLLYYDYPFEYAFDDEIKSLQSMLKDMKTGLEVPLKPRVSNECIDLIKSLMTYNRNTRINMKIVMQHKWIQNSSTLDH